MKRRESENRERRERGGEGEKVRIEGRHGPLKPD